MNQVNNPRISIPHYNYGQFYENPLGNTIQTNARVIQSQQQLQPQAYNVQDQFVQDKQILFDQLSRINKKSTDTRSAEQIIAEFQAYTLPKLRLKRLIKLQALMKGFHTRKFKMPRIRLKRILYSQIRDSIFSTFIEDKFIPDIVLEVVTYNKHNEDLSLYSESHRVHLRYIQEIINKVVHNLSVEVVKEQTDYLVNSILQTRNKEKPVHEKDPFQLLVHSLLNDLIIKESVIVAKESINDLSNNYFLELQYAQIIRENLIPNAVKYVVFDAIDEIIIEEYLDEKITALTTELSGPLATHIYEVIVAEQEGRILETGLENYQLRVIGDMLIENLILIMGSGFK